MATPTNHKEEWSIRQLFTELTQETSQLVRQEIQLAKTETSEKVSQAGSAVGYIAAGGLVAYAGFLALVAAAIVALAYVMPLWLSALLVGIAVAVLGFIFVQKGRHDLRAQNLVPHRTAESLRRDTELIKEHRYGKSRAQQH